VASQDMYRMTTMHAVSPRLLPVKSAAIMIECDKVYHYGCSLIACPLAKALWTWSYTASPNLSIDYGQPWGDGPTLISFRPRYDDFCQVLLGQKGKILIEDGNYGHTLTWSSWIALYPFYVPTRLVRWWVVEAIVLGWSGQTSTPMADGSRQTTFVWHPKPLLWHVHDLNRSTKVFSNSICLGGGSWSFPRNEWWTSFVSTSTNNQVLAKMRIESIREVGDHQTYAH
jgi:hypothetical protein